MIACACPRCGRPAPLALSAGDALRCRACGYHGPLPPEVAGRLQLAGAMLRTLDVRDRQLDASQAEAVGRALAQRSKLRLVVGLASIWPIGWAALALPLFLFGENPTSLIIALPTGVMPLAVFAGLTTLLLRRAEGARERLLAACAAEPPEAPGEPACCHVCGAPLSAQGANAIARCAYCEADNVVHPQAVDAARKRRETSVGDIERTVEAEARTATFASVGAGVGTILALLASPFIGFFLTIITWFGIALAIIVIQPRPYPHRYVTVQTEAGRCIGRVVKRQSDEIDLGDIPKKSGRVSLPLSRRTGDILLKELVGARLRATSGNEGTVVSFHGNPGDGRNALTFQGGKTGAVEGACFLSP